MTTTKERSGAVARLIKALNNRWTAKVDGAEQAWRRAEKELEEVYALNGAHAIEEARLRKDNDELRARIAELQRLRGIDVERIGVLGVWERNQQARIAELEADRDHWRESSVAEGKSKLSVRRELKAQESATQQLSAELIKANARTAELEADTATLNGARLEALSQRNAANARAEAAGVTARAHVKDNIRLGEQDETLRDMLRRWISIEEIDAELARRCKPIDDKRAWAKQFQPCPCGDGTRPGHPMGWCGPY